MKEMFVKFFDNIKQLVNVTFKKNSSDCQNISLKGENKNILAANGEGNVLVIDNKRLINKGIVNNNMSVLDGEINRLNALDILVSWENELKENDYNTQEEIICFFCRTLIPFIKNNDELQGIIGTWRKNFENAQSESISLHKEVLNDCERVIKEIEESLGVKAIKYEEDIKKIKCIFTDDRTLIGFTSDPKYLEAYKAVKELLFLLLENGEIGLCSQYANVDDRSHFEGSKHDEPDVSKPCITSFTFSLSIQKAADQESKFDSKNVQDPCIVWNYFEHALTFWEVEESDIEQQLKAMKNPITAVAIRGAWLEINPVKNGYKLNKKPVVFTDVFLKKGLRTLINDIKLNLKKPKKVA